MWRGGAQYPFGLNILLLAIYPLKPTKGEKKFVFNNKIQLFLGD